MFKIQTNNNNTLKSAFESISSIVDEITLVADKKGIHLRALDRSHITFIILDLEKEFFDEYQCDTPEKINIDCEDFNKILKKCKTTDTLELELEEGHLIIRFKGDAERTFKLTLIDLAYENSQPPHIELPCQINIPSSLLKDYINDMEMFSEKLTFTIDENYFKITTDGQKGDACIDYLHGENILEVVRSCYSIPKLKEIFKANKFSKTCEIGLGDDNPLKVSFKLATGDGELSYLLAPRLETED